MNSTKTQAKGVVSDDSSMQLVYTSTFKGNNTYYVFNKGNEDGFVILSADDSMPAVLADVEGASFDYDKIPENMKWWLSQYDYSIYSYATKGKKYVSAEAKTDIAPLLGGIAWNQNFPYNLKCPEYEGFNAFTGCVATAMAQIMRMHKWPKQGTGKHEYDCLFQYGYDKTTGEKLYKTIHLSADFSKSTYQWDNMPEMHGGLESLEQLLALSQLMYDCGVASNMNYGLDGSATTIESALHAMMVYFGYDTNAKIRKRVVYDDDEWEDLVYKNLSKGLPLLYTGHGEQNAHAFVCDGYKADGNMFHFNWGWGGLYDGYFFMSGSDKTPTVNPTGCDDDDFSYEQCAVFNLKPTTEPFKPRDDEYQLVISRPYDIFVYDSKTQEDVKVDKIDRYDNCIVGDGSFYIDITSPRYFEHDYAIGLKFRNETDEYIIPMKEEKIQPYYVISYLDFSPWDILKNGKYTVSFVYKDITVGNTEWENAKYDPGIDKPVVEVVGNEPLLCLVEKPEIVYDGKVVANDTIVVNPNKKEFTINMKLKALKDIEKQKIKMYVEMYNYSGFFLIDCVEVEVPASINGTVHAISAKYANEQIQQANNFSVWLSQNFGKGENDLPLRNCNYLHFVSADTTTGIEIISQNVENKATETIYDIYGRKIGSMKKGGVYIVNGKKIIVK